MLAPPVALFRMTPSNWMSEIAPVAAVEPPPLFSKPFAEVLARALDDGRISARRAADLLDLTVDDLPDLFRDHGIEATVEL